MEPMILPVEQQTSSEPNIFSYLDYRKFLKELYCHKKLTSRSFSYRSFSKSAGLKSTNFLKLVIDGHKNLSMETAYQFTHAFQLPEYETQFFLQLVLFNQAKTVDEKRHYYEQITRSGHYQQAKPLENGQYAYFSNWYLVALRELVSVKGFKESWPWINRMLGLNLSAQEITQAIDLLLTLKLVQRDKKGRLTQTEQQIQTDADLSDLHFINCHREMIDRARISIDQSAPHHRDLSCLTVSLSRQQFEQIKKEINLFRSRIHQVASESQDPEVVYQINLQLFNLSEVPWE